MNPFKRFWKWFRSLRQRREVKREIDEELRFHLEQRTAENIAGGMTPEDAAREARKRFGNLQNVREECRWFKGASFGEGVWKDIRFAFRQLVKSPVFTVVAVMSLALGIGANTAIFSALNGVLLRSLPVRNPHELRLINWAGRNPHLIHYNGPGTSDGPEGKVMGTSFSYPAYCNLRDQGSGFAEIFAFASPRSVVAVGQGEPTTTSAMLVSGNYFAGYGVQPLIGRLIVPDDDRPDAAPVVVITYRWWKQHCGLNPDVIGRSLAINKTSFTVVGVLPPDYVGPTSGDSSELYVPMASRQPIWPTREMSSPNQWWVQVMGRLAPGADEAQAQASLSVAFLQSLSQSKVTMGQGGIVLEDGSRGQLILRRQLAKPFLALTVAVGLVLLVACANLAGLLLARGAARRHEMAVRTALGAGRYRLIRQSLTESLVLSLAGAGLGLVVAACSRQALMLVLAVHTNANSRYDLSMDARVLAFTLGVSVLTALIFGILPAIRGSRVDPAKAMRSRSALDAPKLHFGRALVATQVGLSLLLVIGAGLMIRTFVNLARVAPGFDAEKVLLFRVRAANAGYSDQQMFEAYDQIRASLAAIPGAQAVTFSSFPLVSGTSSSDFIEFPSGDPGAGRKWLTHYLEVGDGFLRTMKIPLLLGRDLNATDTIGSPSVTVVSEAFARRFFPNENPIGKTFTMRYPTPRTVRIVGVAGDTKYNRLREAIAPIMYFSQRQHASDGVSFAVRSALPPYSLLPAARKAVAEIDSNLPLSLIRTQEEVLRRSVAPDRLFALLGGALALLAMLLSCIGLYGLMAFNVAQRTQEIGVRMALGATRRNIVTPFLREAVVLGGIGITVAVPVALALSKVLKSQLYGIKPNDPLTIGTTVIVLMLVALAAAWIPARRAARVNPMEALRCE